jgi:hypothetical protein
MSRSATPRRASDASFTPGNQEVSGTITRANGVYRHEFTITQPTSVVFDALTNNDNLRWSMTGPTDTGGQREFKKSDSSELSGNPVMRLAPGTYTIAVSATSNTTPSYAFRLLPLSGATVIPIAAPGALTATEVTLNPVTYPAVRVRRDRGQRVFVDYVSGSTTPGWRLVAPNGDVLASGRLAERPGRDRA